MYEYNYENPTISFARELSDVLIMHPNREYIYGADHGQLISPEPGFRYYTVEATNGEYLGNPIEEGNPVVVEATLRVSGKDVRYNGIIGQAINARNIPRLVQVLIV